MSCRFNRFLSLTLIVLSVVAMPTAADENDGPVLSVLDFTDHTDDDEWSWLSAGLADMLLSDLAPTELVLVDRDDLEKVLAEQALALSGITDDDAVELGRLLQADMLLTGSYALTGGILRIDFRITDTTTGDIRESGKVTGDPQRIFELENQLATEVCRVMSIDYPENADIPDTTVLPAARAYYEGLVLQRSGEVEEARTRFEEAAELDPLYKKPRYSLEESWELLKDFRRLRRQQEVNTLWRKAEALEARLAELPFITDSEAIMAAYTAGSPTVRIGSPPDEDPALGSCPTPAVCLWNLQITYWEIGNLSVEYFEDDGTEEAALHEIILLARQADKAWPEDEWLPEILYWEVFANTWLGDWEAVRTGCERIFMEWPAFRMGWALEDFYETALTELGG